MPIDERSGLGRQLNVGEPVRLDLGQFSENVGALIVARMEQTSVSREQAIAGLLNYAAKLMADGVVSLDTGPIFSRHPEVRTAVDKNVREAAVAGKPTTVGKELTRLIIKGAAPAPKAETIKPPADSLGDLFGTIGNRTSKGQDSIQEMLDGLLGGKNRPRS